MHSSLLRLSSILLLLGCSTPATTLIVDHPTGKLYKVDGPPDGVLKPDASNLVEKDEIFVPPGDLHVRVINTNTALYAYGVSADTVEAPEVAALNAFFKDFRGSSVGVFQSAPEVFALTKEKSLRLVPDQDPAAKPVQDPVTKLAQGIWAVESDIIGNEGVQALYLSTAMALAEMQAEGVNQANVTTWAQTFCTSVQSFFESSPCAQSPGTPSPPASTLKAITRLIRNLQGLRAARMEVMKVEAAGLSKEQSEIIKRAEALLGSADQLLTAAQNARVFALRVASARGHFDEQTTVTLEKGRKMTINITPTNTAALQRAADRQPFTRSVTVRPDWLLRPALGASLLFIPKGRYSKFGTIKQENATFLITEDQTDQRFTYGLTLSVTPRFLDFRGRDEAPWRRFPVAAWGEITYNPFDAQQSIALGSAVSIGFFKVGAGAHWARTDALSGDQQVGGTVLDRADLRTAQAYRWNDPKLYISISLIGWQPFTAK